MAKFFIKLLAVAKIAERLLPFVKRFLKKRRVRIAGRAARIIFRAGTIRGKVQGKRQCKRQGGKHEREHRKHEREDIARRLLKLGVEHATICKATGLTRQELEGLR